jgi:hypothetical protein
VASIMRFSGRFFSYWPQDFPAVSVFTGRDFPAVSVVNGWNFPAFLLLLAAGFSGSICCCLLGFSGISGMEMQTASFQGPEGQDFLAVSVVFGWDFPPVAFLAWGI